MIIITSPCWCMIIGIDMMRVDTMSKTKIVANMHSKITVFIESIVWRVAIVFVAFMAKLLKMAATTKSSCVT